MAKEIAVPRSLARGFELLERVAGHPEGAAFHELREETGWAPMTLTRLLQALGALGALRKEEGRYRLGDRVLTLGGALSDRAYLALRADPALGQLVRETGCSAVLWEWDGEGLTCLRRRLAEDSVVLSEVGHRVAQPLFHPAAAICLSARQWKTVPGSRGGRGRDWLRGERERMATHGYAIGSTEQRDRMAAPVFREGRLVGAVLLGALPGTFGKEGLAAMVPPLLAAAAQLSGPRAGALRGGRFWGRGSEGCFRRKRAGEGTGPDGPGPRGVAG